jgi:hypothetical protein
MDSILEFILIILTILIITIIIILVGVKLFSKSKTKKAGVIYVCVIIPLLFLLFNLKLNTEWLFRDYNIEHQHLPKLVDGTWTNVYKINDKKVLKQISAPGVSHHDFTHVTLPSMDRKCYKFSCTLPVMLAHKYVTNIMWKSLKRIYEGPLKDCKYFPKIYEINDQKRYYIQEYIPHDLEKNNCPKNFKDQLEDLNNILKKNNLFLDDVHSKNWRVSDDGILKIIDCEVYTEGEKKIQQGLLYFIDGSQDGKAKGHNYASNVLHWNDGRPNIEDICK